MDLIELLKTKYRQNLSLIRGFRTSVATLSFAFPGLKSIEEVRRDIALFRELFRAKDDK